MATDSLQAMQDAATTIFNHLADSRAHDAAGRRGEAQKARNAAGVLLMKTFSRWLDRFFKRMGVGDDEAQDLTQDCIMRLVGYAYDVRGNAFALVCRARRSVFIDYLKKRKAGKRKAGAGGQDDALAEVQLDDESWDLLTESVASQGASVELVDCVQRKMAEFQIKAASRAEVLEMHAHGLTAREIAAIVYDKAEDKVTAKEEGNVRDRVYNAKKQAQALFSECQD